MCQHVGLQHGHYLINGYANLHRHIFIDGVPTACVLHGAHSCARLPCVMLFCYLIACYWLCTCQTADCEVIAYMDDWLVISNTWNAIADVYDKTLKICDSVGSNLNLRKTYRAATVSSGRAIPGCRNSLSAVPLVTSFKYLGMDIAFHQKAKRAAATRRASEY